MLKILWFVLSLLSFVELNSTLNAQQPVKGAKQIAKTLGDWSLRRQRFKSVRYVVVGETEQMDLPKNSKLPRKRPVKYAVLLDLVRGRIRIEHNWSSVAGDFSKYSHAVAVSAYNNEVYQTNADRELREMHPKSPNVGITKGSVASIQIDAELWPLLFAHGIVPTINKPSRPDRMLVGHDADEFEYRGEVSHQGSLCFILRTDPVASTPFLVDELFIDPGKESAVSRYINFGGKCPWYRFDVTYEEREHTWLPRSWIWAHSAGQELVFVTSLRVESLELNPDVQDDDFTLPVPPGSIVVTSTYPEAGKGLDPFKPANELSQVDARGKRVLLEESGFTTGEGVQLPPESGLSRWIWITVVSGTLVCMLLAVVFYRRRIRRFTDS